MSERFVMVESYSLPIDAYFAKSKLESEGIECLITDDNIVTMNWMLSRAVGGVKLQVKESDLERSKRILEEVSEKEKIAVRCPECNSPDVSYRKYSTSSMIVSIALLGFFLPFPDKRYKCRKCGYSWRPAG